MYHPAPTDPGCATAPRLPREDLRDLLIAAFVAALSSAQESDPEIKLDLSL